MEGRARCSRQDWVFTTVDDNKAAWRPDLFLAHPPHRHLKGDQLPLFWIPRRRHPLEEEGDVLLHLGKMSSLPERPQRKGAVPTSSRLSARVPLSEQRVPCVPPSHGCPWHLAARAGRVYHARPSCQAACCPLLTPRRWPPPSPLRPLPPAVCLRSLSVFPMPAAIPPVLPREILPPGLHPAQPTHPRWELAPLVPICHCPPRRFWCLRTSCDPCPRLVKSSHQSRVPTCDSWVLSLCTVSVSWAHPPHCHPPSPTSPSHTCYPGLPGVGIYWGQRGDLQPCRVCQSLGCVWLCDPMDCSPPGSSVHGILQARTLGWAAISFSRGSSWPRAQTWISYVEGQFLTDLLSSSVLLHKFSNGAISSL